MKKVVVAWLLVLPACPGAGGASGDGGAGSEDAGPADAPFAACVGGSSWTFETIGTSGDEGGFASIALDRGGAAHVSYAAVPDAFSRQIIYATNETGTWTTEVVVEDLPRYYEDSVIRLAPDGRPRIFFAGLDCGSSCTMGVRMAGRGTGGSWGLSLLASDMAGGTIGFDLGGDGLMHAAYPAADGLRTLDFDGATWRTELVDPATATNSNTYVDLVVAPDGSRRIAHRDLPADFMYYASNAGGSWSLGPLGWFASRPSIAIDADGVLNSAGVSHDYSDGHALVELRRVDDAVVEVIDSSAFYVFRNPMLRFDAVGRAHIAYLQLGGARWRIRYARREAGVWSAETVAEADGSTAGGDTVLAVTPAGQPHLAYQDGPVMMYARGPCPP